MKRFLILAVVACLCAEVAAQRKVTGRVVETETQEVLSMTTVKLLKSDSTMVKGVVSDANGLFSIEAPANGRYILQLTNVGFKPYTRNITINDNKDVTLGTIKMGIDAIMLREAVVTANLAKMTMKDDTIVYNAGAYRLPEGSVLEELVRKLPGAKIDDDGKITINGKEVKKILVDGEEFMTGDTKLAMKNLPTSIVEKVKAYDQKSDLTRISGVDDGEEQTVLDFGIKKGMNKGKMSNTDLAIGTHNRYAGRIMGASMAKNFRVMAFGNANNVGDMGMPGGGGGPRGGAGRQGLNSSKMAALNLNYKYGKTLKLDGGVMWRHDDKDAFTRRSVENFVAQTGSFSNSISQNFSRSNSWNANMRIEWTPDTMTNILFRPTFNFNSSDGLGNSQSATFDEDPYLYVSNPLTEYDILRNEGLMVNRKLNNSLSYSDNTSFGAMLQLNRRLSSTGRNITLRFNYKYNDQESKSMSTSDVWLYKLTNQMGQDSTYQTNRYNVTPAHNYNYSAKMTYSEPILPKTYLQFSYEYQYKFTKSTRSTYNFADDSNPYARFFDGVNPSYRSWQDYLGHASLTNPWQSYHDDDLSRFSQYRNYIQDIQVMLRVVRQAYNFNVGVTVMPQKTEFSQRYQGIDTVVTRNVTNFTPTADFRWKISKVSQLRFNYRGSTSQPSISDLLEIKDDSDPLNVSTGNAGLKPSFTNSFRLFYNNAWTTYQRVMYANLQFNTTSNSIANMVTYNPETGGRYSRPENINGNWRISGNVMFNTAIDSMARFNVNTSTGVSYVNSVGYVNLNRGAVASKSNTKNLTISEQLATSFRNDWIEFEITGALNYDHSRNALQPTANLDTWRYRYGFNTNLTLPWGTQLSTDMSMNSRRGFSDNSMNTNELIWNAQISQSMLKGKALTFTLQFYDILREQSTFSRTIDAMRRSDTEYNSITSYAMLHIIYKVNLFGTKEARRGMRDGGPADMPGEMREGSRSRGGGYGGGGNRRGGFGGF